MRLSVTSVQSVLTLTKIGEGRTDEIIYKKLKIHDDSSDLTMEPRVVRVQVINA